MAARGPQNGRRGLERGVPLGFGHSRQLSLNKVFDPSTPSMRKGCDGEVEVEEKNSEKKQFTIVMPVISHAPQWRPTGTPIARAKKL